MRLSACILLAAICVVALCLTVPSSSPVDGSVVFLSDGPTPMPGQMIDPVKVPPVKSSSEKNPPPVEVSEPPPVDDVQPLEDSDRCAEKRLGDGLGSAFGLPYVKPKSDQLPRQYRVSAVTVLMHGKQWHHCGLAS